MPYYAHSHPERPRDQWHDLEKHLRSVSELARQFASTFDGQDWAALAGLWHDIGKYSPKFQQKICAAGGEDAHIEYVGRVDHSTAGAQYAAKTLSDAGKVLAYVIAGHHGGLPDGSSADSCLRSRLEKIIPDYSNCPGHILDQPSPTLPLVPAQDRAGMQFSLFIRMLYSCLVDADFLDTEVFMDSQRGQRRQGYRTLTELEVVFFEKLGEMRKTAPTSPVNRERELILNQCLRASQGDMGLFSLTVPTGGGKTLSSMAFALSHARKHGLKRVIYVIPYTSIIEQNATVFRAMLGDDAVLEHHCNFEPDNEDHRSRLAAENWDAPIIVTTNVQFFESLFASRSSQCRKLHNVTGSVIILDEVQTLPAPFLLPCLEALRELAGMYRASIVLCSATQPAVQIRDDFPHGLEGVTEIIDNPDALATALKRTEVTVLPQVHDTELANRLNSYSQVLCIVNTRKHARALFQSLGDSEDAFHLSALMCPVHRSLTLAEIRNRLQAGRACRVISTQLVEAGVDIDFPVVFRSVGGIDSIAQAAGRCNREGRLKMGQVFVFAPEAAIPAGHFRQTAQAAESVIRMHPQDILSLAAIEDYFKLYYWTKGDALDDEGILAMLHAGCQNGDFPFKTVAEKFRFIKDEMKPVVIPFDDDARRLIKTLDYCEKPTSLSRLLQKYTVSIHPGEWNTLLSIGSIKLKAGMFPVLTDETLYRKDLGLCADVPLQRNVQDLII